ncbi:MAG TPA: hypothetical protein PKN80_03955 [bacterium]|uniref:Uncharacterized protein n=1 Tax=candidate division TA06 bacterium ADurb.Bin417 TaxID=1852828 RepID=A0A1V5MH14_UNCT6|nr:MAG: hypothetical protein BWY73_00826 [candidate division TA06 bacterium ADurb.Bin417]HNQ35200.1 hypothetical protein [bacterium]HNS48419.1 hypothetical protein [bacterium]
MESNRPYWIILVVLAVAFLFFMHSIHGLRVEKVMKEAARYNEIHIVWDWNAFQAWTDRGQTAKTFDEREKKLEEAETSGRR